MCWLQHVLGFCQVLLWQPYRTIYREELTVCVPVNKSKIKQHILLEVPVQAELAFLTASSQEALLESVIPKQGERGAVCSVCLHSACLPWLVIHTTALPETNI